MKEVMFNSKKDAEIIKCVNNLLKVIIGSYRY